MVGGRCWSTTPTVHRSICTPQFKCRIIDIIVAAVWASDWVHYGHQIEFIMGIRLSSLWASDWGVYCNVDMIEHKLSWVKNSNFKQKNNYDKRGLMLIYSFYNMEWSWLLSQSALYRVHCTIQCTVEFHEEIHPPPPPKKKKKQKHQQGIRMNCNSNIYKHNMLSAFFHHNKLQLITYL